MVFDYNSLRVAVSMALMSFLHPVALSPNQLFSSDFYMPFFGQKYFNIKLYSDLYVFMVSNLWILGCLLSFGSSSTMEVRHRCRGDAFNSAVAVDVMVWWSFIFPRSLVPPLNIGYHLV